MKFKELVTKLGLLLCKSTLEESDFQNLIAAMTSLFQLAFQEKKFSAAAQKFGAIYITLKDAQRYDSALLAKQRQITLLCRAGNYTEAMANLKFLEVDSAAHPQLAECGCFKFLTKVIKPLVQTLKENNFAAACGFFNNACKALGKGDALNTLSGIFVYACDGYIENFPNNRAIYETEIRKQLADNSELIERLLGKSSSLKLDQKVMTNRPQPTASAAPAVVNMSAATSGMVMDAKTSETKMVIPANDFLVNKANSLTAMDLQSAFVIVSQFITDLNKIKWDQLASILDPNPQTVNRLTVHSQLFFLYGQYSELDHLLTLHYLFNNSEWLMHGAKQLLAIIQQKLNQNVAQSNTTVAVGSGGVITVAASNNMQLLQNTNAAPLSKMPPPAPRKLMRTQSVSLTAAAASQTKLLSAKTGTATSVQLPPPSPAQHGLAGSAAPPPLYLAPAANTFKKQ